MTFINNLNADAKHLLEAKGITKANGTIKDFLKEITMHSHVIGFREALSMRIISYDVRRTSNFILSCLLSPTI